MRIKQCTCITGQCITAILERFSSKEFPFRVLPQVQCITAILERFPSKEFPFRVLPQVLVPCISIHANFGALLWVNQRTISAVVTQRELRGAEVIATLLSLLKLWALWQIDCSISSLIKKSKRKKKSFKYEDEYKLVHYEVCCIMQKQEHLFECINGTLLQV